MKRVLAAFAVGAGILYALAPAVAAVSAEDAKRLTGPLTPMGAERAGNADGTIPAWNGGYTNAPPGYVQGQRRDDPFPGEKPLFSITADNYRTYSGKLTDGQKALFAKFPDYRMDIYPTHRTAAAPQRVYDAVFANATRAQPGPDGIAYGVTGAAGGIPFPLPKSGAEVIWNHLLAFWGPAREDEVENYLISSDGSRTLTNHYKEIVDFPYYYPGASPGSFGDYYFKRREISLGPPGFAGRAYLLWQPNDVNHQGVPAWQYVPREGRVRKSPLLSYDTPTPDGGGIESFDDYYVFSGSPDRYDFTLIGKREMYIPYNNNRFHTLPVATVAGAKHLNPETLRYELHRVWVVDATLAAGKRHLAPHRRFYVDEDTWFAVYCDAWDADGRLWKFSHGTMYVVPDLPAVVLGSEAIYDLQEGGYVFAFAFNDMTRQFVQTPPHSPTAFSPETLAAEASH